MADVLTTVLYGDSASAEGEGAAKSAKGAGSGIFWAIFIVALAGIVYALASTGTLKNLGAKISGGASELTGGLIGKRNRDEASEKKDE